MAVYVQPAGLGAAAVANTLDVLVTIKQKLCHSYSVNSTNQATANVTFTAGTPIFNGTTVFVPITAQGTITTPSNKCGCNPNVETFTERFDVAFAGQTGVPTAVTITDNGFHREPTEVNTCGYAHAYVLNEALSITITPAA